LSWENDGEAMTNPSDPIEVEAVVVCLATAKTGPAAVRAGHDAMGCGGAFFWGQGFWKWRFRSLRMWRRCGGHQRQLRPVADRLRAGLLSW